MATIDNDCAEGVLLGLACGDALGRPVEFRTPSAIEDEHGTLREMVGDGSHGQPAGTVTDDTDMALCIAQSLVEQGRFDPEDVAERFIAWYESGPFDIGMMTAEAIQQLRDGVSPEKAGQMVWERKPEGQNAGNGSVMRCAPYALAYGGDRERLVDVSRRSSAITHADPRCTAGCALLNCTLAGLLGGTADPLSHALDRVDAPSELTDALRGIPESVDPASLQSTGYVVHTLQTALYEGLTAETAEEGIVAAVNRGGDADTIGAVTGAIVGARFGASALPERWVEGLDRAEECRSLATALARKTIQ